MISLFYKLRLLNYILGSLKDIIVKLFLFTMYLYTFSIVLMFLSNGFWYAVEFCSFKNAFYRLFQYCKWYYENREDLGYGISIRILVAFLTPHFLYKLLLGTGWKSFLKEKIIQILNTRRKRVVSSVTVANQVAVVIVIRIITAITVVTMSVKLKMQSEK